VVERETDGGARDISGRPVTQMTDETFDRSSDPEVVVCVVGMHRSGTSLAARSLGLLGVWLGEHDGLLRPGPDNTAGYWENEAIKELNDVLLAELGGSWDQPPTLAPGWEHDGGLDDLRRSARATFEGAFCGRPDVTAVGFKDPRLSLLLPFWRTVTTVTHTIVVLRDPAEVADSLAARNGMRRSQAEILWLRYLLAAEAADPNRLLVSQTSFFTSLPETLASMAAHVGLPAPGPEVLQQAEAHLDPALRHHRAAELERCLDSPLSAMVASVWNGGDVRTGRLSPDVAAALAQGWLRGPGDDELLAASRAEVVALTEEIRRRNRVRDAQLSTRVRRRLQAMRRSLRAGTPS
jgi:hypothetical protein